MLTKDDILRNALGGVINGIANDADLKAEKFNFWEDGDAHLASIKLKTGENTKVTYHIAVTEEE